MKPRSTVAATMMFIAAALLSSAAGKAVPLAVEASPKSAGQTVAQQEPATRPQAEKRAPAPVARGKKLILTDGSYQVVREWELRKDPSGKGDNRVRYYSTERSRWEELPASLVDFEAMRKAEQSAAEQQAALEQKIEDSRTEQLIGEIDVDSSLEVAPGLFLPEEVGLFVLDVSDGRRVILPLTQVGAESKRDTGRLLTQILVPIPVIPGRHRVNVAGKQAVLRLTNPSPEFYVRTADKREPEMELIRAKVKDDKREIEVINTYVTGDKIEQRNTVSVQRWQVARGVYRLTMSQALEPGEYVLAEVLPSEGLNLYVWDFGVDPPGDAAPKKK
ncbi:MAG: hypothetical protein ACRD5F_04440 [Candidatus Acidiferrales bacterium]